MTKKLGVQFDALKKVSGGSGETDGELHEEGERTSRSGSR
jgi:hypothetical protein